MNLTIYFLSSISFAIVLMCCLLVFCVLFGSCRLYVYEQELSENEQLNCMRREKSDAELRQLNFVV